ncbi:MAG: hypothetical protein R3B57_07675 [Phycisphaerales bacterium]
MGAGVARRFSPIGLDFGARELFAVQLVRDHAGVHVHRAASPPISPEAESESGDGADWLALAWATLARRGFHGAQVALAAPSGSTKSSVVECPRVDAPGAVDEIVRAELARAHRLPVGGFEMAWWSLPGRPSKGAAVLACACEHTVARGLDERFAALGVEVAAIDLRSLALARACAHLLSPDTGVLDAIVEIGWDRSRVLVMGGGAVLYERELSECNLTRVRDQIAGELMTDARVAERALFSVGGAGESGMLAPTVRACVSRLGETIGGELGVSVSYAVRNYGLRSSGRVVCAGPGASIPGLDAVIEQDGGMHTGAWAAPGGGGVNPSMAVAWGLAARFD